MPVLLAFLAEGEPEEGQQARISPQDVPSRGETAKQNARRQGDLGLTDVFEQGQLQVVDFVVSDGGGSKPSANYVAGTLCERRAEAKRSLYELRFKGLEDDHLAILSFDCMGGMTKETEEWMQHLINALAAADPETHPSVIAKRVWSRVAVGLQTSLAVNALAFRYGKLEEPARVVGCGTEGSAARKRTRNQGGGAAAKRQKRRAAGGGAEPEEQEQEVTAASQQGSGLARDTAGGSASADEAEQPGLGEGLDFVFSQVDGSPGSLPEAGPSVD